MSCKVVQIDGSLLEGGGQILRIALTLSVIRKIPVRISKIRAGRSKPGLMEQHLRGVELLRDISHGKLKGASYGSTEIEFWPHESSGGYFEARVKTAGSISLLLQAALPCTLLSKNDTTLKLFGGTNAEMAPQIDYMTEVFRPNLEKFGATFDFDLIRRGYFPKGGGEVEVTVKPANSINPVNLLDRGEIIALYGWSYVAGVHPIKMAHAMADSALIVLRKFQLFVKIERYQESRDMAPDNCAGIILVAETSTGCFLGGSALGKRGESSEQTGKRAADELVRSLDAGACVDEHCQDQLIVFMALAKGPSRIRVGEVTMHTKTAIFIAEMMTDAKFKVTSDGASNIIECTRDEGAGDK